MQWDDTTNAGFSSAPASDLYITMDPGKDRPTAKAQMADPDSLYHEVKKLIEIRQSSKALLSRGTIEFVYAEKNQYPLAYVREAEGEKVLVIINPSDKEQSFPYSAELKDALYTIGGKSRIQRRNHHHPGTVRRILSYLIENKMTGRSNRIFSRISLFLNMIHSQLMQCPGRCNILRLHHHLPFLVLRENREHLIKLQPFCQIKCGNRQSFLKTGAVTVQPRKPLFHSQNLFPPESPVKSNKPVPPSSQPVQSPPPSHTFSHLETAYPLPPAEPPQDP